jgi:hypothetical protein
MTMQNATRRCASIAIGAAIYLSLPSIATASGANFHILDSSAGLSYVAGLTDNLTVAITQESVGVIGVLDASFDYFSGGPLTPGQVINDYFNIFDAGSQTISDTLAITYTGLTPTGAPFADNTHVHLLFLSASTDGIAPSSLALAQILTENGGQQDVLTRLFVEFISDEVATPLPAALPLFATGLGALGLLGWRRKKKAAALAA